MRELIRRWRESSLRLLGGFRSDGNNASLATPSGAPVRRRHRILVVCSSNTCRSPFVAQALQRSLGDADWQVVSAGTDASEGEPVPHRMRDAAAEHGVDLSLHRSRRITRELVCTSDLVVALSPRHVDTVLELEPRVRRRIRLLGGFHPLPDAWEPHADPRANPRRVVLGRGEIPAPRGENFEIHRDCCRELMSAVGNLSGFVVRREASRSIPERSAVTTPRLRTLRAL